MKKILSLLFCLLVVTLNAQERALFRITYDCDALYRESRKNYRWNLDVGRTQSVFYNPANRAREKACERVTRRTDLPGALAEMQSVLKKYGTTNTLEVLTGSPKSDNYTYMRNLAADKFIYTETLPQIEWTFSDGIRQICNYTCRMAVGSVYGRTWTVWYTSEIALSAGPYVLRGLPGVILEAADADNLFHFVAVGIEELKDDTPIELFQTEKAIKCSRAKFLKTRRIQDGKSYGDLMRELGGVKVQDADGNDISHKMQPRRNYLDLE